jgi:hypothetical protein
LAVAAAASAGLAALGAGYAVAQVGTAALGALAEKPELFGRVLVMVGLAEGIAKGVERIIARGAVGDRLGNHAVIGRGDFVALVHCAV